MRKKQTLGRSIRQWLGSVVAFTVILGVGAVLLAAVLVPRIGGATPYTILTSSMTPKMPPGTLVVAKPIDPEDIGIGTVITYQIESGKSAVVTHRVVEKNIDGKGRPVFRTQGDANDSADPAWVEPQQIKGARWYYVPYLGYASNVLTGAQRHIAVLFVAGGLIAYATVMFGGTLVEKKKNRRRTPVVAS